MNKIFLSIFLISAIILTGCNAKNASSVKNSSLTQKEQALSISAKERIKETTAIYNDSILYSLTPLNDLITINEAGIADEIFLKYIYSNNQGSYGEDFLWGAKYDKETKMFYVNNLSIASVSADEEDCSKNLGYYKIPVNKIKDDDFDLFDYRITNFCLEDTQNSLDIQNETNDEGVHLSKKIKDGTLIKKDETGNESAKIYFDSEKKILSVYNSALKEPYFYVENSSSGEIYKDQKGNISGIYRAEYSDGESEKILNKINAYDKNNKLIETYIFNLKDIR